MKIALSLLLGLQMLALVSGSTQSVPVITSAYAREITIDGTADPAAGPVTIFDASSEVETGIGRGDVAGDGKFAAVVKPPLVAGNRLVAIDSRGRRSAQFTVRPARAGATPGK